MTSCEEPHLDIRGAQDGRRNWSQAFRESWALEEDGEKNVLLKIMCVGVG